MPVVLHTTKARDCFASLRNTHQQNRTEHKNGFLDPNNIYFDGSHLYITKNWYFSNFEKNLAAILNCYQMHSIMHGQIYHDTSNKNNPISEDMQ